MSENVFLQEAQFGPDQDLAEWVLSRCNKWRDHYESNYSAKHEEYMRIYRGIWAPEDVMRDSERSRLIAPATAQAVESCVAEVEEATFGRGKIFDIKDDLNDQERADVTYLLSLIHICRCRRLLT